MPRERFIESSLRTTAFYAAVECYEPDLVVAKHEHERPYFSIVLSGGYREACGSREYGCEAGTFTFHPSGECHSDRMSPKPTVELYLTVLRDDWRLPVNRLDWRHSSVAWTARRLADEIAQPDDLSADIVSGLIQDLVLRATREQRTTASAPRWLRRVRDRLRAMPSGSIAELAAEAGVSPGHLSRVFREHFGCSVGEFIREVRLERAVSLYAAEPMTLGELALCAGFADQSHFTRAFRSRYGSAPREFFAQMFVPHKS